MGSAAVVTLRPFFSYYGSKWKLSQRGVYPPPVHETIVEPFAGSAGYSMAHHRHRVVLVERDDHIAGVWRYLIGADPARIRSLPDVPSEGTTWDLDVADEERNLIGLWLSRASKHVRRTPSGWMRKFPEKLWWGPRARERIASQLPAIRHWTVIEADYTEAPDLEATWYVDPPYQQQGQIYRTGGNGTLDYEALGDWVRSRRGQVIACEAEGADWLPFEPIVRHQGNTGRMVTEVAYTSGGWMDP